MITNNYYAIALDDYATLKDLAALKRYNHVAVFSQQVAEKMLKFIVYTFCAGREDAQLALNRHNLKKLYSVILNSGINLELDTKDLTFLEDFYFDTRCPGDNFMNVTESDAVECMNIVEYIKPRIESFLKKNMYCTDCGTKLSSAGECSNLNCKVNL